MCTCHFKEGNHVKPDRCNEGCCYPRANLLSLHDCKGENRERVSTYGMDYCAMSEIIGKSGPNCLSIDRSDCGQVHDVLMILSRIFL